MRGIDWRSKQIDDVGIIGAPAPARPLLLDMPAGSSSAALMRSLPALAPASRSLNEPMRIAHCGTPNAPARGALSVPIVVRILRFAACIGHTADEPRFVQQNIYINECSYRAWLGSLQRMRPTRARRAAARAQAFHLVAVQRYAEGAQLGQ